MRGCCLCGRTWGVGDDEDGGLPWTGECRLQALGWISHTRGVQGGGVGLHRGSVVQKYDIVISIQKADSSENKCIHAACIGVAWHTGPFAKAEWGIKSILPRGGKRRHAPTLNRLFLPCLPLIKGGGSLQRKHVRGIILFRLPSRDRGSHGAMALSPCLTILPIGYDLQTGPARGRTFSMR